MGNSISAPHEVSAFGGGGAGAAADALVALRLGKDGVWRAYEGKTDSGDKSDVPTESALVAERLTRNPAYHGMYVWCGHCEGAIMLVPAAGVSQSADVLSRLDVVQDGNGTTEFIGPKGSLPQWRAFQILRRRITQKSGGDDAVQEDDGDKAAPDDAADLKALKDLESLPPLRRRVVGVYVRRVSLTMSIDGASLSTPSFGVNGTAFYGPSSVGYELLPGRGVVRRDLFVSLFRGAHVLQVRQEAWVRDVGAPTTLDAPSFTHEVSVVDDDLRDLPENQRRTIWLPAPPGEPRFVTYWWSGWELVSL